MNNKNGKWIFRDPAVTEWLDFMSARLDLYEVYRNEYLAEYRLPPKNVMLYRDVILPFCENTLLMDNIAASENINFNKNKSDALPLNRLKIRVFRSSFNQSKKFTEIKSNYPDLQPFPVESHSHVDICYPDYFPYLLTYTQAPDEDKDETDNVSMLEQAFSNRAITPVDQDVTVCLGNEHSFYSILENFIRNSSKHNKERLNGDSEDTKKNLEVFIHISDPEEDDKRDDFYSITLYDNISDDTFDPSLGATTLDKLQKGIQENLITDEGKPNRNALGIADMKINAFLLQSAAEINDDNLRQSMQVVVISSSIEEKEPTFQKLDDKFLTSRKKGATFRFGYNFYLSKPKKIAWIGSVQITKAHKEWLHTRGIRFFDSVNHFQTPSNKKLLAAYEFAVLEPEAVIGLKEDDWENLLFHLPFRVLVNCSAAELKTLEMIKLFRQRRVQTIEGLLRAEWSDFDILRSCWECWLKRWLKSDVNTEIGPDSKIALFLYFEDDRHNEWKYDEVIQKLGPSSIIKFILRHDNDGDVKTNILDTDFNIFFDHHGQGLSKINFTPFFNWETEQYEFKLAGNNSYIQFDKNSTDYSRLFYPPTSLEERMLLIYKMAEAGLMKILVIDERISSVLDEKDPKNNANKISDFAVSRNRNLLIGDALNAAGVYLVNKINGKIIQDTPFDNVVFNKEAMDFEPFESLRLFNLHWDMVIIHRTYLNADWLCEKDDVKSFLSKLQEKVSRIIVTSGGGAPHSLGKDLIRFVPFSSIRRCFARNVSKINLIEIL